MGTETHQPLGAKGEGLHYESHGKPSCACCSPSSSSPTCSEVQHSLKQRGEGCTNHLLTEWPYTAATSSAARAALCPTPEPSPVPLEHAHACGGDNLPAKARTGRDPHGRAKERDPDANKELHHWHQVVLDHPSHLAPRARPGLPQLGDCHTPLPHSCMNQYYSSLSTAKNFFHLKACFPPPQQPLLL